MPALQALYWLLTIPREDFKPYLPPGVEFIKGQLEKGAGTPPSGLLPPPVEGMPPNGDPPGPEGYLHWQVLVRFEKKATCSKVMSVFGKCHAEKILAKAAEEYVWKEGTSVGHGFQFEALVIEPSSSTDIEPPPAKRSRNQTEFYDGTDNKPRIRDMSDLHEDRFHGLVVCKRMYFGTHQSWYNKFKRVLKVMDGSNWRDHTLFINTVKHLAKKNWTGGVDLHVRSLSIFWKSFNGSDVTIRPLILDPSNLGVFATCKIKNGAVVKGLSGKVTVKSTCEDSGWKSDKSTLEKIVRFKPNPDLLTL